MDFESPDVMKEFPGLYGADSAKKHNESDYSDDAEKVTKKDLIGKRKDKKDKKDKERGYAALEGESSPDENEPRSPSKSKKSKSFKFTTSKGKEKREKSREKEKECIESKKVKERKIDKKHEKEKIKAEKKERKLKHGDEHGDIAEGLPIFGVSLNSALERSRCHDGVNLPLPVRLCIDYIEAHGLTMEGVYKVSGNKSKVLHLKKQINHRENIDLSEYDVPTATSLLKMFLRDLPEPVFTSDLLIRFEEAGAILNIGTREKHLKILVENLPKNNQVLLSWILIHLDNVTLNERLNKMNIQSIVGALSSCLHTSHRLLTALLYHSRTLFPNVTLFPYEAPLTSTAQLPDQPDLMAIELTKQESFLSQIHTEMNAGFISDDRQEMLWEVQRIITQLKRKLKILQKEIPPEQSKDESDNSQGCAETKRHKITKQDQVKQEMKFEEVKSESGQFEDVQYEKAKEEVVLIDNVKDDGDGGIKGEGITFESAKFEGTKEERGGEILRERVGDRVGDRIGERVGERIGDRMGDRMGDRIGDKQGEIVGDRVIERVGERGGDQPAKEDELYFPLNHSPVESENLDILENISDTATVGNSSEIGLDCEESLPLAFCEDMDRNEQTPEDGYKKTPIDDSISLMQLKIQGLGDLKEILSKGIDVEKKEILSIKKQLSASEYCGGGAVPVLTEANMSSLDKIMDLLYKENQILQIKKINLVRQIMEQKEICIDLQAKLELLSI